jgi:hypothetical protein
VIEEEKCRAGDCDRCAERGRAKAAERSREGDDTQEQGRGIGNADEEAIDQDSNQRRRCRQGRTGN